MTQFRGVLERVGTQPGGAVGRPREEFLSRQDHLPLHPALYGEGNQANQEIRQLLPRPASHFLTVPKIDRAKKTINIVLSSRGEGSLKT